MLYLPLKSLHVRLDSVLTYMALPRAARLEMRSSDNSLSLDDPGATECLQQAIDWLCLAEDVCMNPQGTVSQSYSLRDGWSAGDLKSTALAIQSFLSVSNETGNSSLRKRARRLLDEIAKHQLSDGNFRRTEQQPPTESDEAHFAAMGEVLTALSMGCNTFGEIYLRPLLKGAKWLANTLRSSHDSKHRQISQSLVYRATAALSLLEVARLTFDTTYSDAALREIVELLRREYFQSNDAIERTSHLRALTVAALFSLEPQLENAAISQMEELLPYVHEHGFLPGILGTGSEQAVDSSWSAMSANLELARCLLLFAHEKGITRYQEVASHLLRFTRRTLASAEQKEWKGAVRGSFPVHGAFHPFEYLTRSTHQFVETQLLELKILLAYSEKDTYRKVA